MPPDALRPGKLPGSMLAALLRDVPSDDPCVRLGPAVGEDAAAIEVPADTLVVATDPITLTGRAAGRYAVVINANDVAVSGAVPRWFLVTVLLPPGTEHAQVQALFEEVTTALAELDATLVGGHTEVTPAVTQPVLVGQMLGLVGAGRWVTSGGGAPGDVLVQIGPAPVEGAAVLASQHRSALTGLSSGQLEAALGAVDDPGICVVDAALRASELGASAMHDPTEGGLAAGLHELADASGVALRLDRAAVAWFGPGLAVCHALDVDPWATLASGCVLATFPPDRADAAVGDLQAAGQPASVLGELVAGTGVHVDGAALPVPARDELARLLDDA